ncbi:NmrA family NAD(P)-binding protein [Saccharothrix sp. BKS2]|uniref:NmrA family NAD(P)-binding protein n=1 Tax=Saccharothrix sp. BKS2 TaxID=3064400 RepID=UPI0039EC5E1B
MTALVIGGTGTTGRRLVDLLRGTTDLRVATRTPTTAEHVRFDWHDPATHAPALRGVDRAYLVPPLGTTDPVPLVAPFFALGGLRRVVLLGSSAVEESDTGLGALPRLVRSAVPEWTVLRPSWFMQNFTGDHLLARGLRATGEIVTATGDGRVAFVDAGDIAAVAARALTDPEPHDTDHVITGPEALSYADAAEVVTRVTGRPARHRSVSAEALTDRLADSGVPLDFARVLAGLDEAIRHGAEDRVTDTVPSVTGRPARTFGEVVAAHRDDLTSAARPPGRR